MSTHKLVLLMLICSNILLRYYSIELVRLITRTVRKAHMRTFNIINTFLEQSVTEEFVFLHGYKRSWFIKNVFAAEPCSD